MKARLASSWERLRSGLWFVPLLMSVAAGLLALTASALDEAVSSSGRDFVFLYGGDREGARTLLATVAGSMVTVAGVTFSVTVVALSLASSQLGPRLLLNFMRDPGNQLVLGTFIATFLFCLLALGSSSEAEDFVPAVSVTVALGMSVASVGVLIYFIHHVASSIRADYVIDVVARDLEVDVERVFPSRDSEPTADDRENEPPSDVSGAPLVRSRVNGYVQVVDEQGLVEDARADDVVIRVLVRAGHFVTVGQPLAAVPGKERCGDDLAGRIQRRILVGRQRTAEQDVEYGVRQLVEVALRALSPGLNDPYTAVTCVDWLGAILAEIAGRPVRAAQLRGPDGELRVLVDPVSFQGLLEAAFNQIRQSSRDNPAVSMRILEALRRIATNVEDDHRRGVVLEQAKLVFESATAADLQELDRRGLEERFRGISEPAPPSAG